MNITICGSIFFIDQMIAVKKELEKMEYVVDMPPLEVPGEDGEMIDVRDYYTIRKEITDQESWVWERKKEAMKRHFDKVEWSDAVLVLNYDKNDVSHYIGPNSFIEMGVAFHLKKEIYLLNDIPEMSYREELLAMHPIVINGDLSLIGNSISVEKENVPQEAR